MFRKAKSRQGLPGVPVSRQETNYPAGISCRHKEEGITRHCGLAGSPRVNPGTCTSTGRGIMFIPNSVRSILEVRCREERARGITCGGASFSYPAIRCTTWFDAADNLVILEY